MKTPATPAQPDAESTAKQQAKYNLQAAQQQQQMNMYNQETPYGDLTYEQTGWNVGPGGKRLPQYTQRMQLSPQEQQLQNQQWQFGQLSNQLGIDQIGKLQGLLSQPVDLSNEAVESRLMELGSRRLNPQFERNRSGMETKLANQGIYQGSEAFDRAMNRMGEQENDAYNQLLLTGRGQSIQEILAARNQPINEITALMSGGQVTQPNFNGTPQAQQIAAPDYAGMQYQNANMGMQQAQMQQSQQNAMMGGLFGLGGAVGGGWARGGFGGFGRA